VIASVRGVVTAVGPDKAVVEVGGVGIAVVCTPATLSRLRVGQEARLATSLVVREDSLTLYGFTDDAERALFELLQTASGVGPRLAQAILSVHNPRTLRQAIATGDVAALTRVPGIGKKGAERLILELRDRVGAMADVDEQSASGAAEAPWREQVYQALIGLGWSSSQANEAVEIVGRGVDGASARVPDLLRQAIQLLGRTR